MNTEGQNTDRIIPAKFKPRARLLLQLGDQLIKNESIALVELVKNAYDADASKVDIYMENVDDADNGIIIIEDDGCGMSADIVENVWLEPGSDYKEKMVAAQKVSPKYNRLPIGEKGIGRFGVHKLGSIIEMTTKSADCKEVYVKIDWTDFRKYTYLDDVPITIVERDVPQKFKNGITGTNIVISKLRKKWERGVARDVKRAITSLSSPFESNDSFTPSFEIFDKPGWFEGLLKWEDVKDYSLYRFKVVMEGNAIAEFKYEFTPWATMTKVHYREVLRDDALVETFIHLAYIDENKKKTYFSLSDCQIGRITFEGYIFDQDPFVLKMGVSDKDGFKLYLKENGGIRVFRDRLRIYDYGEPENDWLGLDHNRFQQPSKAISNNLILASVSLDRDGSNDLVEKTNREGFVDNQAYKYFKNAILHSLNIIQVLRQHDKTELKKYYGPTAKSEPVMSILSEAKQYVEEKVIDTNIKNQIIRYLSKVETDYKQVCDNLLKAAGAGLSMSVVVHEVEKVIYEVQRVLESENASDRVLKLVKHLSSLIDGYAEIIRRSGQLNENIVEVLEQALFNTEYRLNAHKIETQREYRKYKGLSRVKMAKNLLISTIMNLVDNSIYWLDMKSIEVIENKENFVKKIFLNIEEEEGYINIIFADNGTGFLIPTDDVVEPFVSAKPGGMGLGLHIASEVMNAQNGRLLFPNSRDFDIPDDFTNGAIVVLSLKK